MILTLKFWRVFGVIAYIWRDLGLPPLIFENRYLSHFQRNAVILVKTDKIGYKQELAPHPDQRKGHVSHGMFFLFYNSHRFPALFGKKVVSLQNRLRTNQ